MSWRCERVSEQSRSPCGERGLKYALLDFYAAKGASLPVRGAWIEIITAAYAPYASLVAPRAGSVD